MFLTFSRCLYETVSPVGLIYQCLNGAISINEVNDSALSTKKAAESLASVKKFAKTRSSKNSKIEMRWQYIRSYFVYKQLSGSIHSLFKLSSINVIWSPNWRLVLVLKAINQERKSLLIGLLLALKLHLKMKVFK